MEKFITYDGHTVEDFNVYIANARIVQTKHLCSELLALYNNPEFPHKSDFKAVLDTIIGHRMRDPGTQNVCYMFLPEKGATYTLSLNREVSNGASIDLDEDFIRERIVPLN